MKKPTPEAVAEEFARRMFAELGADMVEVQKLNTTPEYSGDCCATHDFTDANMIMSAALEALTGKPVDPADDALASLWSASWRIAKRRFFTCQP